MTPGPSPGRGCRALKLGDNFQGPEQPKKLRGATYNAKIHRPPQEVKRAVQQFTKANKLDFVQLQEISGYHKELSHIPGYRLITFPGSKDHGETGVLVRKGIDVKFPQSIEADHGWTNVHGGPAQPRAATSVKIAGWLRVASVHAPPGVDFHGDHATGGATRVDSYKSLTRKLANAAKRYQENDPDGAVLLGGDWNEGSHTSGVGSPSWLARVAHLTKVQKAPIDWEMVTGAKISNMKVRKNFGSDHHLVTFTIEKR
ncbi:MAG: hypothetical protein IPJ65_26410 [Archangiaceae bacterium]|nr:hypothetical protein [Archangiaceae bacterium]